MSRARKLSGWMQRASVWSTSMENENTKGGTSTEGEAMKSTIAMSLLTLQDCNIFGLLSDLVYLLLQDSAGFFAQLIARNSQMLKL